MCALLGQLPSLAASRAAAREHLGATAGLHTTRSRFSIFSFYSGSPEDHRAWEGKLCKAERCHFSGGPLPHVLFKQTEEAEASLQKWLSSPSALAAVRDALVVNVQPTARTAIKPQCHPVSRHAYVHPDHKSSSELFASSGTGKKLSTTLILPRCASTVP